MEDQAQAAWLGLDTALQTAINQVKQPMCGPVPASLGLRSDHGFLYVMCPQLSPQGPEVLAPKRKTVVGEKPHDFSRVWMPVCSTKD